MIRRFRISKGPDVGDIVDSIEAIEAFVRDHGPGRYHVDEIGRDPLPSGHRSGRWGVGIKLPDGTVAIEPDSWPDR
jgi:hypothetical protein